MRRSPKTSTRGQSAVQQEVPAQNPQDYGFQEETREWDREMEHFPQLTHQLEGERGQTGRDWNGLGKEEEDSEEPPMETTGNREKPVDRQSPMNLDKTKVKSPRKDHSKGERGASEELERLWLEPVNHSKRLLASNRGSTCQFLNAMELTDEAKHSPKRKNPVATRSTRRSRGRTTVKSRAGA